MSTYTDKTSPRVFARTPKPIRRAAVLGAGAWGRHWRLRSRAQTLLYNFGRGGRRTQTRWPMIGKTASI